MNKTYRTVSSRLRNTWVVVSETASHRGKSGGALILAGLLALGPLLCPPVQAASLSGTLNSPMTYTGSNDITSSAMLTNASTMTNAGELNNAGWFKIKLGGTLENTGTLNNLSGGELLNDGRLNNTGTLTNTGALSIYGPLQNKGTMTNESGGSLTNMGALFNSGTFTNNAQLTNYNYQLANMSGGTMTNNGTLYNVKELINMSGGKLNNNGTLDNAGLLDNDGKLYNNGTLSNRGTLENAGTLDNQSGGTLTNTGFLTNEDALSNAGTLNNNGGLTNQFGATLTNDKTLNNQSGGTLTNEGTLLNESGATLSNQGRLNNQSGSVLENTGALDNAIGARLHNAGTLSNEKTLTNRGSLENEDWLDNVSGATLTNTGTLSNTSAGLLDNAGTLENAGSLNNAGTLNLSGSAQFTGAGTVNNSGQFNIGAGIKATTGTYTQASGGTLTTRVARTSSYGQLEVNGTATLAGSLFVDASGASGLTKGDTLSSIIHANTISGKFSSVTDNSTLFDFAPVYSATDVNLTVKTAASSGGTSVYGATVATGNHPGSGAARTLDAIFAADPGGKMAAYFQGISGGDSAVSAAVNQTLPQSGVSAVASDAISSITHVIQARQASNGSGMASGDEFYGDRNFWMKPFGSRARQADQDGISGYKANTGGIVFGADAPLDPRHRVGLAFAYANAHVTGNSTVAPNSADIDLYQLIGYGSIGFDADTEINYQADIGNNRTRGQRDILFANRVASANYTSLTAHLGAGIAHAIRLSERSRLTPSARIDYISIRDHGYSETGADALNLNVEDQTTDALTYTGEARLSHDLSDSTTLIGSLGVAYTPNAKASNTTAAYAGEPGLSFSTAGASPEHWSYRGGLGMLTQIKNGPEITARYDLDHRSDFNNHTLSAKLKWVF